MYSYIVAVQNKCRYVFAGCDMDDVSLFFQVSVTFGMYEWGFLYNRWIIWETHFHKEYTLYELDGKFGYMNRLPSSNL